MPVDSGYNYLLSLAPPTNGCQSTGKWFFLPSKYKNCQTPVPKELQKLSMWQCYLATRVFGTLIVQGHNWTHRVHTDTHQMTHTNKDTQRNLKTQTQMHMDTYTHTLRHKVKDIWKQMMMQMNRKTNIWTKEWKNGLWKEETMVEWTDNDSNKRIDNWTTNCKLQTKEWTEWTEV